MSPREPSSERAVRPAFDAAVPDVRPWHAARRLLRSYWVLSLIAIFSCVAGAAATRSNTTAKPGASYAFAPNTVLEVARRTSANGFTPRRLESTALQQLSYDQLRDIRFNADAGIWRNEQVPFRVELLPAGFLFQNPVKITLVENRIARDVIAAPEMFSFGPSVPRQLANQNLPLSGFRARTRLNSRSVWDEFLVFQGASYFRAVQRGGAYGLSARGLAIRTAHAMGEEFPAFTHYWIERPTANATGMVVHALLDSPSTTGAYRFAITPGAETVMDVDVTLFPRVTLDNIGIAPLTSMFLFDESERTRIDDFRDEVHDSDGLQIVMASGERVWRPLTQSDAAAGVELHCTTRRRRSASSSARVACPTITTWRRATSCGRAPGSSPPANGARAPCSWSKFRPTTRRTTTSSRSGGRRHPIPAGKPWHSSYRLRWTRAAASSCLRSARPRSTRTGPSFDGKRRIFIIEFAGTGPHDRRTQDRRWHIGRQTVELVSCKPNPLTKGVRASFELDARRCRRRGAAPASAARRPACQRNVAVSMDGQLKTRSVRLPEATRQSCAAACRSSGRSRCRCRICGALPTRPAWNRRRRARSSRAPSRSLARSR